MSKKRLLPIEWKCKECNHNNKTGILFGSSFKIPYRGFIEWDCEECQIIHRVDIDFGIYNSGKKKRAMAKRIKKDKGTKKDRAYKNDHGSHR
jgi:hypothetical protein